MFTLMPDVQLRGYFGYKQILISLKVAEGPSFNRNGFIVLIST